MNWISVKNQTPLNSNDVLIALDNKTVVTGSFLKRWGWVLDDTLGNAGKEITHWMPFPEAPKS